MGRREKDAEKSESTTVRSERVETQEDSEAVRREEQNTSSKFDRLNRLCFDVMTTGSFASFFSLFPLDPYKLEVLLMLMQVLRYFFTYTR